MSKSNLPDRIIEYSFYLLLFLVPLIMTPFNYELFEFNKMILVYLLTTIIVASWLIKMVLAKKLIFRRTFWDIPLIIFFLSQFLSFIFSCDQHTSFWGYYSRFNGGLLSTTTYLLCYWAWVSNMGKRETRKVIRYTLIGAVLVAGYGIAERFGIDAQYWVQDVKNRVFSTLGQPNWLAAYLAALIPITWALKLNPKFYILNAIFYSCLLFTRSRSGFLAFGTAYLLFWSANWRTFFKPFLVFTFSFLVLTLLIGTPWTENNFQIFKFSNFQTTDQEPPKVTQTSSVIPTGGTESGEIRKIVWQGAIDIWRHYPIFGTGPETFAYSYYWHRPREHNDVSEWDFLYNKAHNEYLNLAATTGTVGLASYLVLIAVFLVFCLKSLSSPLIIAFMAGYMSILVTNFFGFSVVIVSVFFFLFPAFAATMAASPAKSRATKQSFWQLPAIIVILLFTFYFLHFTLTYWQADTLLAKGEKLKKAGLDDAAFNAFQLAVKIKPNEPLYHDALSDSAGELAAALAQQENATLSAQLAKTAIEESNQALKISQYHLNFWKNRTKLFYQLAKIDPQYYQQALESLLHSSKLAPTDPKLKYHLGLLYAILEQPQLAITTLEESIDLKPNYENARYALALFYEQAGEKQKAKNELEYILEKISPESERTKEKLKTL